MVSSFRSDLAVDDLRVVGRKCPSSESDMEKVCLKWR